jgi:hypothetical protein
MADSVERPQPEALLSELKKASRGKLKIFLGAAPGVGKTYAILETHGRAETELLLDGLDVLPRKQIVYRDRIFYEMDIDAILKRRPRLAIVDELAHTNVPGSRHVKRYQDVEEIINSGIDVYTTLNIQHLESLNDIIARIARIKVRNRSGQRSGRGGRDRTDRFAARGSDRAASPGQGLRQRSGQPRDHPFLQPRQPDRAARIDHARSGGAGRCRDADLYEGARHLRALADARAHHGLRQ